jgi:predicted HTH transcriptional regulator
MDEEAIFQQVREYLQKERSESPERRVIRESVLRAMEEFARLGREYTTARELRIVLGCSRGSIRDSLDELLMRGDIQGGGEKVPRVNAGGFVAQVPTYRLKAPS